jgi:uncharacterized protein
MILTLTERCNLRCDYCYVPVEHGRTMTQETADRAVDWFVANAADDGTLGLSFFGGEPFLAGEQVRRAVARVRALVPSDRRVRVVTPTNALAMSEEDVAWCRWEDIELAIGIDGGPEAPGRKLADGGNCACALANVAADLLRRLPPRSMLARMTVTPANVGSLCASIRTLARLGFKRVVYLPDYDAHWDESALALWQREHERLVTWMVGARSAGKKVPELPAWKAIEARLVRGAPRRRCGAGVDQLTVTPDGGLYPCYRFPYAKDVEAWRLGDVHDGITHPEKVAQLERLDADRLRPERGACASCPAADGCTHFCPAVALVVRGDVGCVPEIACRLMEMQVASVRALCAARPRPTQARPALQPWAKAAMVAIAATGMVACGNLPGRRRDAGAANDARDARGPVVCLPVPDAAADKSQAIDADRLEVEEPWVPVGGYCP